MKMSKLQFSTGHLQLQYFTYYTDIIYPYRKGIIYIVYGRDLKMMTPNMFDA